MLQSKQSRCWDLLEVVEVELWDIPTHRDLVPLSLRILEKVPKLLVPKLSKAVVLHKLAHRQDGWAVVKCESRRLKAYLGELDADVLVDCTITIGGIQDAVVTGLYLLRLVVCELSLVLYVVSGSTVQDPYTRYLHLRTR